MTDESWRHEYKILGEVIEQLAPLTEHERARVLLIVILRVCPRAFDDHQLMALVQRAKEPA
jgi:hypothetical protein